MVDRTTIPQAKPHVIYVTISGGTDNSNDYAYFRNGRTFDYKVVKVVDSEAVINLKELTVDGTKEGINTPWAINDKISIVVTGGGRRGATIYNVDSSQGGARIALTLTDVSTTNAPAVAIG